MSIFNKIFGGHSDNHVDETANNMKSEAEQPASAASQPADEASAKPEAKPAEPEKKAADGAGDKPKDIDVHHLIVLDESGSMSGVRMQTISGCNETIQTIKQMQTNAPDQHHYVSIYLFDSGNSRYIMRNVKAVEVREITDRDYCPNACTPLFDAMGDTLTDLRSLIDDGAMGYVTIITDGYENSSSRYNLEMVKKLISELKEKGVVFSFIGANIDAKGYADRLGINNAMQFTQNDKGMQEMWMRERRSKMRSSAKMQYMRMNGEHFSKREFAEEENTGAIYDEHADPRRTTPAKITSLQPGEVFVFGSNIHGAHNGGAAAYAVDHFGAVMGQAEGMQGQSYAIPTVGVDLKHLYIAIDRFIKYAAQHPELTFLVTAIGCGHGGWSPYEVAPIFARALRLPNVKLPAEFWPYL